MRQLLFGEIEPALSPGRPDENMSGTHVRQDSHTAEAITARLKRDDPELAEKVVRGEISPNAAAREKGWRKPRIILSTPERVADSIRKHMPPDARRTAAQRRVPQRDGH
jgi:hypothetical protein